MSQENRILEYLKLGHSLTPLEALEWFGCFRLGARIWELQKEGWSIESQLIKLPNKKHCASYRLAKNPGSPAAENLSANVTCHGKSTQGSLFQSSSYTDY